MVTVAFYIQIKVVDPATKRCTTLAGSGQSGLVDGSFEHAQFSEPGGLCLDPTGETLFVADTNNHAIRVLNLDQRTVSQVQDITMNIISTMGCQTVENVHRFKTAVYIHVHTYLLVVSELVHV